MLRMKASETPGLDSSLYDASPSPSVPTSFPANASDKENPTSRSKPRRTQPSSLSRGISDISSNGASQRAGKRKAPAQYQQRERRQRQRTATPSEMNSDSEADEDAYDPDQDIEQRRRLRGEFRNLEKDLNENRSEFLQPHNDGLRQTLINANRIIQNVKQTGDATIDSRLLVNTADLSLKKIEKLTLGNSQLGVDVDHFIAKCMTYMRNGSAAHAAGSPGPCPSSSNHRVTQRRRRVTQHGIADSDSEDGEEGDMLDWAILGAYACLPFNSRPAVSGFLFGPLSMEKRVRRATQRRVGMSNKDLVETRPEILKAGDIHKEDNNNLTVLCMKIDRRLREVSDEMMELAEEEATQRPTQLEAEEMQQLLLKYGIDDEGNVDLFRFVINPKSFGQTIENMFYVSFLIRDGSVGIILSDDGLPYLSKSPKFLFPSLVLPLPEAPAVQLGRVSLSAAKVLRWWSIANKPHRTTHQVRVGRGSPTPKRIDETPSSPLNGYGDLGRGYRRIRTPGSRAYDPT